MTDAPIQFLSLPGAYIPRDMVHVERQNGSFFFGYRSYGDEGIRYIGKPSRKDGHILVVGGAGSGKTSCIVTPTLKSWDHPFFAIDVKGDLVSTLGKSKYPTKVFCFPGKDEETCGYDPFYLLREGDPDDLVRNAKEIAQAILPVPPNIRDDFWIVAAQNMLTAVILYVYGLSGTFNEAMAQIQSKSIRALIDEISESKNEAAIMHINQFCDMKHSDDDKLLEGIAAEVSNRVMAFPTDNRIRAAFDPKGNTMKWEDLNDHNIIMRVPEDKLSQWDGVITMMLTQLIRTLERRPEKYISVEQPPPVLLMFDEFPRLGKLEVIRHAVSTLRSKGVTICLVIQSLAQLDDIYGKNVRQIIIDNCSYKVLLNISDPESQRLFSDMVGSANVRKTSVSNGVSTSLSGNFGVSFPRLSLSCGTSFGVTTSRGTTVSEARESIIYPSDLAYLKDLVLLTPEGHFRIERLPYYKEPPQLFPRVVAPSTQSPPRR